MKAAGSKSREEIRHLDHETLVDLHFITPAPGKKTNHIRCYCRHCKKMIKDFLQEEYDEKFVQITEDGQSLAHKEMIQAWLDHLCDKR